MLETIISKLISTLETDRDDTLSFETDNLELDVGLVRYIQFEIIEDFEDSEIAELIYEDNSFGYLESDSVGEHYLDRKIYDSRNQTYQDLNAHINAFTVIRASLFNTLVEEAVEWIENAREEDRIESQVA